MHRNKPHASHVTHEWVMSQTLWVMSQMNESCLKTWRIFDVLFSWEYREITHTLTHTDTQTHTLALFLAHNWPHVLSIRALLPRRFTLACGKETVRLYLRVFFQNSHTSALTFFQYKPWYHDMFWNWRALADALGWLRACVGWGREREVACECSVVVIQGYTWI